VRAQSVYLRSVSIVEACADSLLDQLFERRVATLETFYRLLSDAAVSAATQNWDSRKLAFKDYHGVILGECPSWSQVDAAITVRNAIAHGLGRLTARQRNSKDRAKVRTVGIRLRDDYLEIDAAALGRCLDVCSKFISELDHQVGKTIGS